MNPGWWRLIADFGPVVGSVTARKFPRVWLIGPRSGSGAALVAWEQTT
jgi:hypothetical protein